jgi:hypothetical protein
MNIINSIIDVFLCLLKANLLATVLVFGLYLIEINSEFKLFVKQFKWKKSINNARIQRNGTQVYYFIFCCGVYIYDLYKSNVNFTIISFVIWLITLIFLSTILGKIYDKYQGVDPNKADDDVLIR